MVLRFLNFMNNFRIVLIFWGSVGGAWLPLKALEYERIGLYSEQDLQIGPSSSLRVAREIWISPGMGERMVNPSGNDPIRNEDDRVRLYEGRRKIFADLNEIIGENSHKKITGPRSERILDWSMIFDEMNLSSALIRGFSQQEFSRKAPLILERVNWDHSHSLRVFDALLERGIYPRDSVEEKEETEISDRRFFITDPALGRILQKRGFPSFPRGLFSGSPKIYGQLVVPCLRKIKR